ncbi:MAG TPA: ABC transporter ATP-binding protein [Candidatus Bipolaricaulis sp.]|nr:ABC transporter ATP-binding protein [Candidatus Bipolaricaulis sp.]HRS13740.1 ABC transporter ATP-binding protein [Candidatus Bipolaricaulis sp.]HRU21552.1 ABC transporter ATP-binding protein [Candidatus Bipolaricaulis sp.]
MQAVEVRDLRKDYGAQKAVQGISFDVREGEIFGLIGPNGAGKTTTLRIVSTLLSMTSGSVRVFGHDVTTESDAVRRILSYLPEEAGAYRNLTGRAYLEFIARFFGNGEKVREMVERGVEIADLGERINDKISTLSKGMTRRLLVGRALMTDPKLAVLDEPTSGLDVINAREIRGIIRNSTKGGRAVLLSSHNMLEVELLCDRIALIHEGRIVEAGSPAELKGKYAAGNIEDVFAEVVKWASATS